MLKLNFIRDKRIWLFGCWEGNRYDDNSKFLFEYMVEKHPEIRCIWITNRDDIQKKLNELGYEAYLENSRKGFNIQLKAGVCLITNGMDDIAPISFAHGATIVALWHGQGMKKTFYASDKNGNKIKRICKKIKDKIYNDVHVDYIVAGSDLYKRLEMRTFKLKSNQCLITGLPRNDIFKNRVLPSMAFSMDNADAYRYILYFPTFRQYENSVVENFMYALMENKEFVDYLKNNRIRFIAKLHYLCRISIENTIQPPFYLFSDDEISTVQELLAASDCMITDFSSAITDFCLQKKPALIFAPDYKQMDDVQGIYDEWKSLLERYACNDVNVAATKIIQMMETGDDGGLSSEVWKLCENPELVGTCYCENVYQAVSDRILLK
ncbi:MAG: CDP-glycerol glycerophosphotransferase family protein [Clostridiales bacterium]|nr:CDP-glycerol glycerophosphotransferase family protein [Clostridiales bacterium]